MDKVETEMCDSDNLFEQLQRTSFKSLPSLEIKDSLDDIKEIKKPRQYSEHSKKNAFCSFVKKTTFETRPKRNRDLYKKSNPELSIHKMRHKLSKEKGMINFDIHKLGKKIMNHFKKDFSQAGPSRIHFKTESLNEGVDNLTSKCDLNVIESETNNIIKSFKELSINEIKSSKQKQTILTKSKDVISGNFSQKNNYGSNAEIITENVNKVKNSGDSVENGLIFKCDDSRLLKNFAEKQSEIVSCRRRSVQWNREVDVVYYAGDVDGGKILAREREPLREEADQQARHKKFDELIMKKNFLSIAKGANFRYSWHVTLFK